MFKINEIFVFRKKDMMFECLKKNPTKPNFTPICFHGYQIKYNVLKSGRLPLMIPPVRMNGCMYLEYMLCSAILLDDSLRVQIKLWCYLIVCYFLPTYNHTRIQQLI